MNKILRVAALSFGVLLLASAPAVFAAEPAVAKIPFPFVVGDKVLPAGEYRVSEVNGISDVIQIISTDGGAEAVAAVETSDPDTSAPEAGVVFTFKIIGDQRYLVSVTVSGQETMAIAVPAHAIVPAR